MTPKPISFWRIYIHALNPPPRYPTKDKFYAYAAPTGLNPHVYVLLWFLFFMLSNLASASVAHQLTTQWSCLTIGLCITAAWIFNALLVSILVFAWNHMS